MKTKYFSIIAVALALVACGKNNDDFNIDNTKDTPHHHRFGRCGGVDNTCHHG